jgi:hypothetical protein
VPALLRLRARNVVEVHGNGWVDPGGPHHLKP